jgi:two-component sensor histidine kinase
MAKKTSPDFLNFFQNHPSPSWICDKHTLSLVEVNKAAIKTLGFSRSEWKKMTLKDLLAENIDLGKKKNPRNVVVQTKSKNDLQALLYVNGILKSGKQCLLVVLNAQQNHFPKIAESVKPGEILPQSAALLKEIIHFSQNETGEIDLKTLHVTLNPELLKAVGINVEETITASLHHADQTAIEERLKQSVQEKEMLIKEIHHRVKNNLQIISSIIYLKMISLEQSDIRSFLDSTRQKIKSIALIHERLLQSEKLDEVEIADYLGKLLIDIQVSHYRDDLALVIEQDVESGLMPLDTAIYCGLIINELLTNSIKHAFRDRRHGIINVSLNKNENKYILQVRDNGITIPEHIIPGKANSFGLQMLDVFVKQLNGSWRIIRDNGTIFLIRF